MKRLIAALLFCSGVYAQDYIFLKNFDYSKADSMALRFPKKKYKTVSTVAELLIQDLSTDHEKFRTIFRWITDNIEYNKTAMGVSDADKVVRKNRAVCMGFSSLLKEMCNVANIPCEIITGYTKTEVSDINRKLKKTDHAWNCVKLYGKWYLVDVTWATSKLNLATHKFQKDFDEYYYLTPPEKFILDHFPAPPSKQQADAVIKEGVYRGKLKYYFQFLEKPVKEKAFSSSPVYYPDFFHLNLTGISPQKGTFKWSIEKPLRIEISSPQPLKEAGTLVSSEKFLQRVDLKEGDNGSYYFDYTFPIKAKTIFTVYVNGQCVAEYLVEVK